ncbi:hypothetical protein L218DRAFT_7584 [Marasmius fiardii PR-910]|nr:hypothetical protein L218DRAFT_7584 [Marasmius fiardii PR-910]
MNSSVAFKPIGEVKEHELLQSLRVVGKEQVVPGQCQRKGAHSFLDPVSSVDYLPFGTLNSVPIAQDPTTSEHFASLRSSINKRPHQITISPVCETTRPISSVGPLPSPSWPYAQAKSDFEKREIPSNAHVNAEDRVEFDSGNSSWKVNNGERSPEPIDPLLESGTRGVQHMEAARKKEKLTVQREGVITTTMSPFPLSGEGHLRTTNSQTFQHPSPRSQHPHTSSQLRTGPRPRQRGLSMYGRDKQHPLVMPEQSLRSILAQSPYRSTPDNVDPIPHLPQYHHDLIQGCPVQYVSSEPHNFYSVYNSFGWSLSDFRPMQNPGPCERPPSVASLSLGQFPLPSSQLRPHLFPYQHATGPWYSQADGSTFDPYPDRSSHYDIHPDSMRVRAASLPLAVLPLDTHYDRDTLQYTDIRAARQFLELSEGSSINDRPHNAPQSLVMPSSLRGQGQSQRPRAQSFHHSLSHSHLGKESAPPLPAMPRNIPLRSPMSTAANPSKRRNGSEPLLKPRKSSFFAKTLKKMI